MRSVVFLVSLIVAVTSALDPQKCSLAPCSKCPPGQETVFVKNAYGCDVCECKPNCDLMNCEAYEYCHVNNVICVKAPCPPLIECRPCRIYDVKCKEGEDIVGDVDANGCKKPRCVPTCKSLTCGEDEYCKVTVVQCVRAPCPPLAECASCPAYDIRCMEDELIVIDLDENGCKVPRCVPDDCPLLSLCAPGYETIISKGENGCPVHHCKPTCDLLKCPAGQLCELVKVTCVTTPCFDQPTCVVDCPVIAIDCLPGYEERKTFDKRGCEVPICVSPCQLILCPKGSQCVLKVFPCLIAPCPVQASCAVCPQVPQKCPPNQELYTYKDENGCKAAVCIPSCDGFTCRAGEQCVMEKVVCKKEPCYQKPRCVVESKCKVGKPLQKPSGEEIFCGRGPTREDCPPSYTCVIHPTDMFAVCCPECPLIKIGCKPDEIVVWEKNEDGCEIPHCESPCASVKCPQGTQCVLKEVQCPSAPCQPIAACEDICSLPKVVGPCEAATPRWHFNGRTCERFTYGGCDGNANNFNSLAECQKSCHVKPPQVRRVCRQPKEVGPCDGDEKRWYYSRGCCKEFQYGGCGGNGNNFKSLMDCQKRCLAGRKVCRLPKLPGPCRGSFNRWYYDTQTKKCELFTYGGCLGNGNNFLSPKECMEKCYRPRKCRGGQVWKECATHCPANCKNPHPVCIELCAPAQCQCPPEKPIWSNRKQRCIAIENCRKCKGGQVWKECATHCPADCKNPHPVCIKSCAPAQCQCPPEKPIWSKRKQRCITIENCHKCRKPMVYKRCGSACPLTCKMLQGAPIACPAVCVEGCFCPKELPVRHGKACIAAKDCPQPKPEPEDNSSSSDSSSHGSSNES